MDYVQLVASKPAERRLQVEDVAQRLLGLAVDKDVSVAAAEPRERMYRVYT